MTLEPERLGELRRLLEALCEERITPEEAARPEPLVLADPQAEALYITYLTMQADLVREIGGHPAAAGGGDDARPEALPTRSRPGGPGGGPGCRGPSRPRPACWRRRPSSLVPRRGTGGGRSGEPRSWPAASAAGGSPAPAAAGSSSTIAMRWPW